jgi:hypothetical protein
MKWSLRFLGLMTAGMAIFGSTGVPVLERDGVLYGSAARLETEAEIAIKELPSRHLVAACFEDRCATVENTVRIRGELFVPVLALADALGGRAVLDETRQHVAFEFSSGKAPPSDSIAQVGGLAPDLRLTLLDGRAVSLADFRGKRVLINSWASW